MEKEFEKFTISQTGVLIRNDKCLILEFSNWPGRWGLPGGRLDVGEVAEPAFKREIKEELGIDNFDNIAVVDYDIWYTERKNKPVCAIVNLIINDEDEIVLSHEHSQMKWVSREELKDYDFVWPKAAKMLDRGFDYYYSYKKGNRF